MDDHDVELAPDIFALSVVAMRIRDVVEARPVYIYRQKQG